jgi:hypothetical protein
MPKIIVESKNILRFRVARKNIKIYKLRINDERTEDIMPNVKNEIAMDYGKQTIQVYNSFFEKSPKKIIDVNSETQEYKITLHYKIWLILSLFHCIMTQLIIMQNINRAFVAISITMIEIAILIYFGAFELKEVKNKLRVK